MAPAPRPSLAPRSARAGLALVLRDHLGHSYIFFVFKPYEHRAAKLTCELYESIFVSRNTVAGFAPAAAPAATIAMGI